jgi:hypothetical protein
MKPLIIWWREGRELPFEIKNVIIGPRQTKIVSVQRAAFSYQLNEQIQKDMQMGKVDHFCL